MEEADPAGLRAYVAGGSAFVDMAAPVGVDAASAPWTIA